jgi:hypothetical protein
MSFTRLWHSKSHDSVATFMHTTTEEFCEVGFSVGPRRGSIWKNLTRVEQSSSLKPGSLRLRQLTLVESQCVAMQSLVVRQLSACEDVILGEEDRPLLDQVAQ